MLYHDPIGFAAVRRRHALYRFEHLTTLIPGAALTWLIVKTTSDPAFSLTASEPSQDFNREVTAFVCEMQNETDHEVRNLAGADGSNARSLALLLSLALDVGGNKLMNCSADDVQSRLMIEALRSTRDRIRAGSPPSAELVLIRQRANGLGCGLFELAA